MTLKLGTLVILKSVEAYWFWVQRSTGWVPTASWTVDHFVVRPSDIGQPSCQISHPSLMGW